MWKNKNLFKQLFFIILSLSYINNICGQIKEGTLIRIKNQVADAYLSCSSTGQVAGKKEKSIESFWQILSVDKKTGDEISAQDPIQLINIATNNALVATEVRTLYKSVKKIESFATIPQNKNSHWLLIAANGNFKLKHKETNNFLFCSGQKEEKARLSPIDIQQEDNENNIWTIEEQYFTQQPEEENIIAIKSLANDKYLQVIPEVYVKVDRKMHKNDHVRLYDVVYPEGMDSNDKACQFKVEKSKDNFWAFKSVLNDKYLQSYPQIHVNKKKWHAGEWYDKWPLRSAIKAGGEKISKDEILYDSLLYKTGEDMWALDSGKKIYFRKIKNEEDINKHRKFKFEKKSTDLTYPFLIWSQEKKRYLKAGQEGFEFGDKTVTDRVAQHSADFQFKIEEIKTEETTEDLKKIKIKNKATGKYVTISEGEKHRDDNFLEEQSQGQIFLWKYEIKASKEKFTIEDQFYIKSYQDEGYLKIMRNLHDYLHKPFQFSKFVGPNPKMISTYSQMLEAKEIGVPNTKDSNGLFVIEIIK